MKIDFKFPKLKLPQMKWPKRRRKIRASATMSRGRMRAATADYDEMSEPNMKLSRALLIVLILHVVAVSGIIAFNAIKTREGPAMSSLPRARSTSTPAASGSPSVEIKRAKPVDDSRKTYVVAKGENPVTIAKKLHVPYDDLIALNHIDDPRKLKVGQKLLVPNKSTVKKKSEE
jgi:LysM repeat protein